MHGFNNIYQIVEQLEKCGYEDSLGHTLEMNAAFIRLKEISESNYRPDYFLNEKVIYMDQVCFISGINAAINSHPQTAVTYSLSEKWNHESTTNKSFIHGVKRGDIMAVCDWNDSRISQAKKFLESSGYVVSK